MNKKNQQDSDIKQPLLNNKKNNNNDQYNINIIEEVNPSLEESKKIFAIQFKNTSKLKLDQQQSSQDSSKSPKTYLQQQQQYSRKIVFNTDKNMVNSINIQDTNQDLNSEFQSQSTKNQQDKFQERQSMTSNSHSQNKSRLSNSTIIQRNNNITDHAHSLTLKKQQYLGQSLNKYQLQSAKNYSYNFGGGIQQRLNRTQTTTDICEEVLKFRQQMFLQSQVMYPPKNFQNSLSTRRQENTGLTSVIQPFDKTMFLTPEYLETFQQKWEWPADIQKALDHEKATSIGKEKTKIHEGREVIDYEGCKCCLNNINKEEIRWYKANVNTDLPYQAGTAIPLFFSLIKYYITFMILVFLVNGVYILYQSYHICELNLGDFNCCYKVGPFDFASREFIRTLLYLQQQDFKPGQPGGSGYQVFTWVNFASYVLIMVSQLFVDVYISYYEKKMDKPPSQQKTRSLLISHIPKFKVEVDKEGNKTEVPFENDEQIEKHLLSYLRNKAKEKGLKDSYKVVQIFLVHDYSKYNDFYKKRTDMYYKLKPILNNQQLNKEIKIIEMRAYMYFWNLYLKQEDTEFEGRAVITFENSQQAFTVRSYILTGNSILKKVLLGFLGTLRKCLCSQKIDQYIDHHDNIQADVIPEPYEIIWHNFGLKSRDKTKDYILSWLITILVIIVFGFLIIFISQTLKSGLYYFFAFVTIISIHTIVMQIITLKRKGKTHSSNAYFLLSRTTPFQVVFICVMPFVFYLTVYSDPNLSQYQQKLEKYRVESQKVFALFLQMIIFMSLVLLVYFIDIPECAHRNRKKKIQKYKLEKQYCQSNLNEAFAKPEFQLELHLLNVIKIWSFSALHAFLSPLSLLIGIIMLVFIYYLSKYHLFKTYTVKNFKSLTFIRRYLWYYGHYYQLIVLAIYLFLQDNDEYLTFWLAILTYAICVIVNIVRYYRYLQTNEKRRKEDVKQSLYESTLQDITNSTEQRRNKRVTSIAQSVAYEGEQTYYDHYKYFKQKYFSQKLEDEITEVLGLKKEEDNLQDRQVVQETSNISEEDNVLNDRILKDNELNQSENIDNKSQNEEIQLNI